MKLPHGIAIFFLAICALPMSASAQKVYKCGSTYSQIPCSDAVAVDASDARTKEQKAETEKAAQRDAKAAVVMEKTRLKEEKELLEAQKAAAKEAEKAKAKTAEKSARAAGAASQDSNTGSKSKKKEPEFFTATTPPEKKK